MLNIKLNFIAKNFNSCKISMIEHFLQNNIIPNKIYYCSNFNLFSKNEIYQKISKTDIFLNYPNNSIILLDMVDTSFNKNILNKINSIKNIIIFSTTCVYLNQIELNHIYSNPLFTQNVFIHKNKTMELELFKRYKNTYYQTPIIISYENNNDTFNKIEYLIENPIDFSDKKQELDEDFDFIFF